MSQHLLAISELDRKSLESLLAAANRFADQSPDTEGRRPLSGRLLAQLFYEPSTRTRCSFEIAARRLGAEVINLDIDTASTVKGESVLDTVRTLAAMGVSLFVIRHGDSELLARLSQALPAGCHLINAGAGSAEHPTQALLDMLTLQRAGLNFADLDISIVGDLRHSRVASSAIQALQTLGTGRIRLGGPPAFMPATPPTGVEIHHELAAAIKDCDVVMALRIQRERMTDDNQPVGEAYHADWGLNEARLAEHAPAARVMHPGPMNRGVEIDDALADGPRSLILEQVRNGVAARMAVLEWLNGRTMA